MKHGREFKKTINDIFYKQRDKNALSHVSPYTIPFEGTKFSPYIVPFSVKINKMSIPKGRK